MKYSLLAIFTISILFVSNAQKYSLIPESNEQLKITSSIEYKKLPFKMKMIKKMLPKKSVSYYSKIGNRLEININGNIMGQSIISSTTVVQNYIDSLTQIKVSTLVNDTLVDDVFKEKKIDLISTTITFGEKKKKILGYDCVYFISENDSIKTEGFLTSQINGIDEFKNYGMPLDYKTTNKKEKSITITTAIDILIEPLEKNKFILSHK